MIKVIPIGIVLSYKFFSGELISKGYNFELTIVAHEDVADEEVIEFDLWVFDFFEKDFMIFDVVLYNYVDTISICCAGMK